MNPEDLKLHWEELSRRLERQQIVNRSMLRSILQQRRWVIASYTWFNIALCILGAPVLIGIAACRGLLHHPVLYVGLALLCVSLFWEILKLRPLLRMERMQDDIIDQEREVLRYMRLQKYTFAGNAVISAGFVGWLLISKFTPLQTNGTLGLVLSIAIGVAAGLPFLYLWERRRIRNLRKALEELREFSEQ